MVQTITFEGIDDNGGEGPHQEKSKDDKHHQFHPEPGVHVDRDGGIPAFQHVITSSDSASYTLILCGSNRRKTFSPGA